MKVANLETTTIPLVDSDESLQELLHWGHLDSRAVVIAMIPKSVRHVGEILDNFPVTNEDRGYANGFVLPPRFIKGYFDVKQKKFIDNPLFEENPTIKEWKPPTRSKPKYSDEPVNDDPFPSSIPQSSDSAHSSDVW